MTKRSTAARSAAAPRGAAFSLALVLVLVLVVAAPAAAAVPPLPGPVQDAVDTVDNIASSDDPVADAIDAVDDAIGDATGTEDPIQDTVDEVTGTGEQVVDDVEETVDGVVDTAEDVVDKTGNAVDRVDDATGGTIGDLIGGGSSEGPGKGARAPRGSAFGPDGFASPARRDGTAARAAGGGGRAVVPGSSPARSVPTDGAASPNDPFVAAEPGLAERLRDAAIEASKKLALPLALTIVVLGYVVMQYWADRKDPKLVLAPLESDHDLLSFQ